MLNGTLADFQAHHQVPVDFSVLAKLDSLYQNPLKIGRQGIAFDLKSASPSRSEADCLARTVAFFRPKRTLEIGLALGASAIAIAAASTNCREAPHLALDPFQDSATDGPDSAGLIEIKRLALESEIEWVKAFSENYLPTCVEEAVAFDFVFIDGGHQIGQKVVDAYWIDRCLAPNGLVAFHDAFLRSTKAAVEYLVTERGYRVIPLPPDNAARRLLRSLKYWPSLGWWYASRLIPLTHRSILIVQKSMDA